MQQLILVVPRICYLLLLQLHLCLHGGNLILHFLNLVLQTLDLVPALSGLVCRIHQLLRDFCILRTHLTFPLLCFLPQSLNSLFELRLESLNLLLTYVTGPRLTILHETLKFDLQGAHFRLELLLFVLKLI